jgi:hypothetical protein
METMSYPCSPLTPFPTQHEERNYLGWSPQEAIAQRKIFSWVVSSRSDCLEGNIFLQNDLKESPKEMATGSMAQPLHGRTLIPGCLPGSPPLKVLPPSLNICHLLVQFYTK